VVGWEVALLEYHLDRRVVLNRDSEFKNLYEWSLQELDAEGSKVGLDQIPWEWSLYFRAKELTLSDTLAIEQPKSVSSDDNDRITVSERRFIKAKLSPESGRSFHDSIYSMFGTNRTISSFELHIEPLQSEDQQERCMAWGCVSYTSEIDFRYETMNDTVIFYMYVRPGTFDRYAAKIAASEVNEAILRVGGVAGFYSEWSPSVSTGNIKVLTSHKEHVVETLDEIEIDPPRLGTVGEVELYLRRISKIENAQDELANEDDEMPEKEQPPSHTSPSPPTDAHAIQYLASDAVSLLLHLRTAAWIVAGLLFLIACLLFF
jgi:hypothetical protein